MKDLLGLFCPDLYYDRTAAVNLQELWDRGIRGLILDLDNTLVAWRSSDIPADVLEWSHRATEMGFKLCIASNTRRYARLSRVADALGAIYVTGVAKPRRGGFRDSVWKMGLSNSQSAVIGDQLLTDVFGAKRTGLMAVYVDRINRRELFVTKFNRRIEAFIVGRLMRAGRMPEKQGGDR
jgi:HAD superfamily phosphatase (TIGR01668 family)